MSAESKPTEAVADGPNGSGSPLGTRYSVLGTPPATHTIRLGPPWEVVAEAGLTRHTRNFGHPRTLDPGDRVWLVCDHLPGAAEVAVNGTVVGTIIGAGAFAADVTEYLRPRNKLVVAVASDGPLGRVALEFRPAAR